MGSSAARQAWGGVLGLLAVLALAFPLRAQEVRRDWLAAPRSIAVEAFPFDGFSVLDRTQRQFGRLTFLSGLELQARDKDFGGISAASINADGKGFIAINDHGFWLSGRFVEKNGALAGVESVRLGPLLAPNGRRLKDTRWFDSEGLARVGRHLYVSVERVHDILRFSLDGQSVPGRAELIDVPRAMKDLDGNGGVEALGVLPSQSPYPGALIAIGERAPRRIGGDMPGWIIDSKAGGARPAGSFHLIRKDDFDTTDLGFLPGGDMLVLERRFKPFSGVAMRIRRIPLVSIRPGARLDGETLIEADMSHQIDNMEAMMIHRREDGKIILTLMSDNNFSLLQRNLVLQFAYDE